MGNKSHCAGAVVGSISILYIFRMLLLVICNTVVTKLYNKSGSL